MVRPNKDEESWHKKGAKHFDKGEYLKAIEFFDKELDSYSKDYANKGYFHMLRLVDKGMALENLHRYDEALEYYGLAFDSKIAIDRHMMSYPFDEKCRLLVKLGRHQEALEFHDKALMTDLDPSKIWHSKGKVFQNLKRNEEALECFNKAIVPARNDQNLAIWESKGIVLNELERYSEALQLFDYLLSKSYLSDYRRKNWLKHKAHSLFGLQRYVEAIQFCDQYLKIKKDAWVYYLKATSCMKLEKNDEALESLEQAIKLSPKYAWAWYQKGLVLYEMEKNEDALHAFEKASEDYPEWIDCLKAKNKVLEKLGFQQRVLMTTNSEQQSEQKLQKDEDFASWLSK